MTGKLLKVGTIPAHLTIRMGPLSSIVSPFAKWATTKITRYPIDIKATTLVYLRESNRRRKDNGITINLSK